MVTFLMKSSRIRQFYVRSRGGHGKSELRLPDSRESCEQRAPTSDLVVNTCRGDMQGNAAGSTLRLTLGCLLGLELRRVGSGTRRTFASREADLSAWMEQYAAVCWIETNEPWLVEKTFIASVNLPLNLDQNRGHVFHPALSELRRAAKRRANELPVWSAT